MYPIKRNNNRTLYVENTKKFTLRRPKSANFNGTKTFKITNSQNSIDHALPANKTKTNKIDHDLCVFKYTIFLHRINSTV